MQSEFGARLSALRKARGLTQAQLAEATGLSIRSLSYYENHAYSVSGDHAVKLAAALGVPLEELLGATSNRTAAVSSTPSSEDIHLWRRFQKVRSLPARDQRAVFRLVNSLAGTHDDE